MPNINLLDAGFTLILILFLARGCMRGMIREIAGLVGIFLAFVVAARYYSAALPHVQRFIPDSGWATTVSYALVFVAVLIGVALFATVLRKVMSLTFTAWVDYLGGALVGCAEGLLLCSLALVIMRRLTPDLPVLQTSALAKHITKIADFIMPYIPTSL